MAVPRKKSELAAKLIDEMRIGQLVLAIASVARMQV